MAQSGFARQRVAAWLIDLLMVLGLGVLFHALGWLASLGYWLLRDGCFEGQSIGKRLIGLKVVVQSSGRRCTFKESVIRNLLWVVPVINLAMGVTACYAVFSDAAGRHWGDRLAETTVVHA